MFGVFATLLPMQPNASQRMSSTRMKTILGRDCSAALVETQRQLSAIKVPVSNFFTILLIFFGFARARPCGRFQLLVPLIPGALKVFCNVGFFCRNVMLFTNVL